MKYYSFLEYQRGRFTKAEYGRRVAEVFYAVRQELRNPGNSLRIPGFGTFVVVKKPARNFRDPRTKQMRTGVSRARVIFRPAESYLKALSNYL